MGDRPALVLVHGGGHTSQCWQPTVEEVLRRQPEVRVLAVDLPGRRGIAGDLATLTIEDLVAAVVRQVEAAGLDRVVLVGHSMGGLTVPGVAAALGSQRVARMVLVACCVPAQGASVVDALAGPLAGLARRAAMRARVDRALPRPLTSWLFCNGMTREQRSLVHAQMCPESSRVTTELVDRSTMPLSVPRTWVLTGRDRILWPRRQRRFIANLGGVDEVVEIDACHDVMVSHPRELAHVLLRS